MALICQWFPICDKCGETFVDGWTSTRAELLRDMQKDGWKRRGKEWHCPDCVDAEAAKGDGNE